MRSHTESHYPRGRQLGIIGLVIMAFAWSYWPALAKMWQTWGREADYSHGYLVVPLALTFLWLRRFTCPKPEACLSPGGLSLIGLSVAMRLAGALWYIEAFQDWSLLLWVIGACWLLGGAALLRWALPAIGFLPFMIPLPYGAERSLSLPLQHLATNLSCWLLQCLGEPAIAEGNVVLINDSRLLVAEACSGLRIFVSILAMAYVFCALIHRPWWTKLGLFLSVPPIALVTNSLRIVATGLAHEHFSGEWQRVLAHDFAGWLMVPLSALLMYVVLWYLGKVIVQVETISARELLSPPAAR